jgi:hypothetical protein
MNKLLTLFLASRDFQCTAHAFFPERLSNLCQGFRRNITEIYTKFDAVPLSDPSQNRIRPDIRFQIKELKRNSISTHLREILYTDSQDMLVLSSTVASRYHKCCTEGIASPGNYGYPIVCYNRSETIVFVTAVWTTSYTTQCHDCGPLYRGVIGSFDKSLTVTTWDESQDPRYGRYLWMQLVSRPNRGQLLCRWLDVERATLNKPIPRSRDLIQKPIIFAQPIKKCYGIDSWARLVQYKFSDTI